MNNSVWLDINILDDYLEGKLDAAMMHKVERASLEDPFVAEALAGLSADKGRIDSLSLLQKQLQQRVAEKPIVRKMWRITAMRLSIGAAAAVLFITVSMLYFVKQNPFGKAKSDLVNNTNTVEITLPSKNDALVSAVEKANQKQKVDSILSNAIASNAAVVKNKTNFPVKVKADKPIMQQQTQVPASVVVADDVSSYSMNATVAAQPAVRSAARMASPASTGDLAYGVPVNGWDDYNAYLAKNNRYYTDGTKTVLITFFVNNDGVAENIKAIDASDKKLREEAVRLIKAGGKWKLVEVDDKMVKVEIKF